MRREGGEFLCVAGDERAVGQYCHDVPVHACNSGQSPAKCRDGTGLTAGQKSRDFWPVVFFGVVYTEENQPRT